jgi:hypothetical protein
MYENADAYSRPLKGFLNDYLEVHQNREERRSKALMTSFRETTDVFNEIIGRAAFRPIRALNAAVAESMMVGVARRLERGPIKNSAAFERAYAKLIDDSDYMFATTSSTAAEESVELRLDLATKAFRTVS